MVNREIHRQASARLETMDREELEKRLNGDLREDRMNQQPRESQYTIIQTNQENNQ